ncbi:MAG: CdaR family protein [Thermodesulfovibrio sp.]|jgi:YbbR domain-containing protein|uniref:CdaR family protein n=1 Tax=unclassified Thermodesulfovibrio TaxID=2645936 RepID=UPI00083A0B66|nr:MULTISPECIES: CdaR family protein [unclassified Thermodesulfovibrio]MDI1472154.1 CdaR family protein [Thermodesulfovibrio sp. 1176]MDI6715247.1 CdaR family protein [Thermodesulfovibrio sp.]ODA45096.1 putative secreted protein associated with spyDAC [Thermodesulfovibrio sp. N1]
MKKFFKNLIAENLTFKLISIALAVFLWFFVTFKGQTETYVEIPIEFKGVPAGMEILKQNVKKINISISARERIIREIAQNNIRVIIDLSNAKLGENSIPITKSSIKIPRGVEILRIEPSIVKVHLDKKSQKMVPVKAVIVGNPEKGFIIRSVELEPSQINIEGAKKELDRIQIIKTEPIDIEGIKENISIQTKIDPEGKIFRSDKDIINVKIEVRRRN